MIVELFNEYRATGINVIPIEWDIEKKQPVSHRHWASADELPIFKNHNAIMIKTAMPYHCFDFDIKNTNDKDLFNKWFNMVRAQHPDLPDKLYIEKTRNAGYHVWFQYPAELQKLSLADSDKGAEVIALYAGGPLVYTYPTPGYEIFSGSMADTVELSKPELFYLIEACQQFNEYHPSFNIENKAVDYPQEFRTITKQFDEKLTDENWDQILQSIGLEYLPGYRYKEKDNFIAYHRRGSSSDGLLSAKVLFGKTKRLMIFSASMPEYPNWHNKHEYPVWCLPPSFVLYYKQNRIWSNAVKEIKKINGAQPRPIDYLPSELITASCRNYQQNNLWQFFAHRIGEAAATDIFLKYQTGTANHWPGATAFWQVDGEGRARQCKVMQYDAGTGKRVKQPEKSFVAFMGKTILGNPDANLQQCFFGAHLLPLNPSATVCVVESEKTAMWMAHHYPAHVWLATGGKNGCRWMEREVLKPLKGKSIVLFPDLDATESWRESAVKMAATIQCRVHVDSQLQQYATDAQRGAGWDIMDFHLMQCAGPDAIRQNRDKQSQPGPAVSQPDAGTRGAVTADAALSWEPEIVELESFFASIEPPNDPVKIAPGSTIIDCAKFIRSHIATVKHYQGNKTFLPHLERLRRLRELMPITAP